MKKKYKIITLVALIILAIIFTLFIFSDKKEVIIKKEKNILSEPEERISVSLPYSLEDEPNGMVPIGETVYHPVMGHPGIDFGWEYKPAIRASADGIIKSLPLPDPNIEEKVGELGLVLESGQYLFEYGSMGEFLPNIKIGAEVKKGDILGFPFVREGEKHAAIHWEMKPNYEYAERLCPITYFDPDSKARIEKLWENSKPKWDYLEQFPEICNGHWAGLNSFADILKWENSPEAEEYSKAGEAYKKGELKPKEESGSIAMCYFYSVGQAGGPEDVAWLDMKVDKEKVSGEYESWPAQKDSKTGYFEGTVGPLDQASMSRRADVILDALAEGMQTKEEMIFDFGDGSAAILGGEKRDQGDGTYIYLDKSKLFKTEPTFGQIDCTTLAEIKAVRKFLKENIGAITTEKPVLGGTWYLLSVKINTAEKIAKIIYEDGHIQGKADVTYAFDPKTEKVTIKSFEVK